MAISVLAYDKFWEHVGKSEINLSTATFKIILVEGYDFSSAHDVIADIGSVELSTGNGYTAGGQTISGTTYGFASGVTKFDGNDITWNATGGDIGPAQGAVIFCSSSSNRLVCYIDFGQEETAGEDTVFKITFNVNGIFTIA